MANESQKPLLSGKSYDQDAPTVSSDQEDIHFSDSEVESLDQSPAADDRRLLDEPDEDARLLTIPSRFDNVRQAFSRSADYTPEEIEKRRKRNVRRAEQVKRQVADAQGSEVVYEMEEGFKYTSSTASSVYNLQLKDWPTEEKRPRRWRRTLLFGSLISLAFVILTYGSYRASSHRKSPAARTHFNGTHSFAATTILVSLDGFRADFLQRGLTPALNAFIQSGVSPKHMLPSFPSVTFPNHYTLVTGLYPESHGIVSNQFWDPEYEEEFYYTDTAISMQPKWWESAEPLWVTAENQGVITAVHMWPGSEAHIHGVDPTYLDKFKEDEPLINKVDRVLHWLDMEQAQRPRLIAAYVPDVDADGHKYGPNSTEIRGTIADVDSMLTLLVDGLFERNLTDIVNLVVVSDHGMATTSVDRLIQLDDLIDMTLVDHIDGWPLRGLRLRNPDRDVPILYQQLSKAANEAGSFEVYTLETMPKRYHFSNNPRIAPLWVVPKTGWAVVEKVDFDVAEARKNGQEYEPKGLHGYDHEHPLMRAIFVARGPAFPHVGNSRVPVFQNTEVYNIVCDSIGIIPHNNNGTLRLPLQTEGLHSDFDDATEQPPADPVSTSPTDHTPEEPTASPDDSNASTTSPPEVEIPVQEELPSEELKGKDSWWKFVHDNLEKAKDWAKQIMDSLKGAKSGDSMQNS